MTLFPTNVLCETSTVTDGNMSFREEDEKTVVLRRTEFLKKQSVEYTNCCVMTCDHGETITLITNLFATPILSEVLVTQQKNIPLFLLTADCQPMSFYDPVTQTIALAHISRKTLVAGLIKKTIAFLSNELNVDSKNLSINIGPSIKKESYVFSLPLQEEPEALLGFVAKTNEFAYIDLIGASIKQLTSGGIESKQISVSEIDTGTSTQHYSYYQMKKNKEKDSARMATILMLRY